MLIRTFSTLITMTSVSLPSAVFRHSVNWKCSKRGNLALCKWLLRFLNDAWETFISQRLSSIFTDCLRLQSFIDDFAQSRQGRSRRSDDYEHRFRILPRLFCGWMFLFPGLQLFPGLDALWMTYDDLFGTITLFSNTLFGEVAWIFKIRVVSVNTLQYYRFV